MILPRSGQIDQWPEHRTPNPCRYHLWDALIGKIPSLRWLEIFIRGANVPADRDGFWRFSAPIDKRIFRLMNACTVEDRLIARGHLLRLADDKADVGGNR